MLSTWRSRPENPMHDALGLLAERHLGPSSDKRWSLGDAEELRALLVEGGFTDLDLQIVSKTEVHTEFPVRLSTLAAGFDLTALSEDERERRLAAIEAESRSILAGFAVPGGFGAPSRANVVIVRRPS